MPKVARIALCLASALLHAAAVHAEVGLQPALALTVSWDGTGARAALGVAHMPETLSGERASFAHDHDPQGAMRSGVQLWSTAAGTSTETASRSPTVWLYAGTAVATLALLALLADDQGGDEAGEWGRDTITEEHPPCVNLLVICIGDNGAP